MNLKHVAKEFTKEWNQIDFDTQFDNENNALKISANLSAKAYDDEILLIANIYDRGDSAAVYIEFCFDELELTNGTLRLINGFNEESLFLKAHVDSGSEQHYLRLTYNVFNVREEDVVSTISFAMNEVTDDDIEKILKPITLLTE